MAEEGIFCTKEEVERKAGANVSAVSKAEAYSNDYVTQVESLIKSPLPAPRGMEGHGDNDLRVTVQIRFNQCFVHAKGKRTEEMGYTSEFSSRNDHADRELIFKRRNDWQPVQGNCSR